jgi:hypothetical protein
MTPKQIIAILQSQIEAAEEENIRLCDVNAELVKALEGVVRVADRKTDEFDAARAALTAAQGE